MDDVGAVEASAEPDFDDADIDSFGGEIVESEGGKDFKEVGRLIGFVEFDRKSDLAHG